MIRKIVVIVIILVATGMFYGLGRQIYDSLQSGRRLDQAASEVAGLQTKNSELKKRLDETQNIAFVEQQARDKLNLARPNETVVVVPQSDIEMVLGEGRKVEETPVPNWQGWLKLFIR